MTIVGILSPRRTAIYNAVMFFEIVTEIRDVEIIAVSTSIRSLRRLNKQHGKGRWRKLRGTAEVRLSDGAIVWAEIHWYEAHGIGRREHKIKRILHP